MKRLLKITVLLIIAIPIGWYAKDNIKVLSQISRVDAAGSVTFDLGVAPNAPIFTFQNIAPGFSQSKTVTVHNGDTAARLIGVKGVNTGGTGSLENAMSLVITENGNPVYGGQSTPKTLADFFNESNSINGITLSTVNPGASTEYVFTITFLPESGNEYQNTTLTFDLTFGLVTDIPQACSGMKFTKTIYGTGGNDNLRGTTGNDLIISFDGDDRIDGGVGDDCIVAGGGNNRIQGGVGNDVILGGGTIDAGVGNDTVYGSANDDTIDAGVGNDYVYGGAGNDHITAGVGNDYVDGGEGNDTLVGDVGNDTLIGGDGNDSANGNVGRDTCSAETTKLCEF